MRGLLLAALVVLSVASRADERILDFHSDIRIEPDGGMEVTETIRVRAEGNEIRRGIYRDFPTDYEDRFGHRYRVGFTVHSVRRDGMAEPYRQQSIGNGVRVYIGNADLLLPPGEYEYQLRYRTDRQIGFFADHDELYWNVTGNGWGFPIDSVSARVSLPAKPTFKVGGIEGYVGAAGSTEQAYDAELEGDRNAVIRATRGLQPREGLTLVVSWPKEWIAEPTRAQELGYLLAQNAGLAVSIAGLLSVFLYFLLAWRKAGRDPEPGVIFPHYEPPERFSPASIRYISRMAYDTKAFSAAIINLAVKGHVDIDEAGGKYTLRAIEGADAALAPGEQALLDALFGEGDRVLLDKENHKVVRKAMSAHEKSLQRDYRRIYFLTNSTLLIPGVLILLVTAAAVLVIGQLAPSVVIVLAITVSMIPIFYYLLKAPTRIGRQLLDKVEGFKQYLEIAEKDEVNLRNPPQKTPELFEAYLPYALALAVEQPWAEKFARAFTELQAQTGAAYSPSWYHGHWDSGRISSDIGRFTTDMTSALGSAVSSASAPPGSSSGSGGGGSSGGGGGGGGGGGW
jgi:uncharacterized protein (TIGR04222 family)